MRALPVHTSPHSSPVTCGAPSLRRAEGEGVDEAEAAVDRAGEAVRAVGCRVALVETAAADHDRRWEHVRKVEDRMAHAAETVAASRSELAAIGLEEDEVPAKPPFAVRGLAPLLLTLGAHAQSLRGPLQEAVEAVDAARRESEATIAASQRVLDTARAVVGPEAEGPQPAVGENGAAEAREGAMEEAEAEAESTQASLTAAAERAERVVRSMAVQVGAARSEQLRVEEARRVARARVRAAQERLQAAVSLTTVRRTCHAPTVQRRVAEARAAVETSLAGVDAERTVDATTVRLAPPALRLRAPSPAHSAL